jgi:hypothetical protein
MILERKQMIVAINSKQERLEKNQKKIMKNEKLKQICSNRIAGLQLTGRKCHEEVLHNFFLLNDYQRN